MSVYEAIEMMETKKDYIILNVWTNIRKEIFGTGRDNRIVYLWE